MSYTTVIETNDETKGEDKAMTILSITILATKVGEYHPVKTTVPAAEAKEVCQMLRDQGYTISSTFAKFSN